MYYMHSFNNMSFTNIPIPHSLPLLTPPTIIMRPDRTHVLFYYRHGNALHSQSCITKATTTVHHISTLFVWSWVLSKQVVRTH